MKQTIVALVALLITSLCVPEMTKAQSDGSFYSSVGLGIAFNAPGKNISLKNPALDITVGKLIGDYFTLETKMRMMTPYSPTTRDSSWVYDPGDSITPPSSHYNRFYQKTATLLLNFGVSGGSEAGFTGGINTGVGAAFVEVKDELGACPIWDFSLEGGYNFGSISVILSATYSYLWSTGDFLPSDGFSTIGELRIRYYF